MKRGLVIADTHLAAYEDLHPSYRLVKRFAKDFRPDFVVHLGDFLELAYFSKYDEYNIEVQSKGSWENDVDLVNREIDYWTSVGGDFYFLQGNHDERTERIAQQTPKFAETLDYPRRFHLRDRKVPYFRQVDGPLRLGKLALVHGWYYNIHHTKKTLLEYGGSIVYGHVHGFQTYAKVLQATGSEIQAWSIGCLTDKQPEYRKGRPTGHQNGFGVLSLGQKGSFTFLPVNITKHGFIWDRHEYRL